MGRQNGNTTLYTLQGTGGNPPAPQFLSQIDAFKNLNTLEPQDGVIPYDMIEDFWSDGADKARWQSQYRFGKNPIFREWELDNASWGSID